MCYFVESKRKEEQEVQGINLLKKVSTMCLPSSGGRVEIFGGYTHRGSKQV